MFWKCSAAHFPKVLIDLSSIALPIGSPRSPQKLENSNRDRYRQRLAGYQNLRYLLLKTKRMAVTNAEFIAVHTIKKAA
jgi:hypothetical protein